MINHADSETEAARGCRECEAFETHKFNCPLLKTAISPVLDSERVQGSQQSSPLPSEPQDDELDVRCEVEWERPKSALCKPHRCDLPKGHKGNHLCDCGWPRRLLERDEPERFERKQK